MLKYTTAFRAIFVIAITTEVLGRGCLIPSTNQERSAENELQQPRLDGRIVGGSYAERHQFPHQASLLWASSTSITHICGGSIISNRTILTAARCVYGHKASKIKVRLGSSKADWGGEIMPVRKIIVHEKFNKDNLDYDIALLETSKLIKFGVSKQPVKLPNANYEFPAGEMCTVTGFGKTKNSTALSKHLQKVDLPIVNQIKCDKIYQQFGGITDRMICAGCPEGGKGPSHGDSGGPLLCNGLLAGIVSWGKGGADGFPDVYTRVSSFHEWISDKTGVGNF